MSDASPAEVLVCRFDELNDPGCREFRIGAGAWPFRGFVVRKGDAVYAYQNFCMHAGHPLNWNPDRFLTGDAQSALHHMGAHLVLSMIAVPVPGVRSAARFGWTLFFWVKTQLRRFRRGTPKAAGEVT
ncbi:MAG: Rieske (2Fe-2S) protein, partial [Lysobacterales bacterium]